MMREVPVDPLLAVFTDDVIAKLEARRHPTEQLTQRLKVLRAEARVLKSE